MSTHTEPSALDIVRRLHHHKRFAFEDFIDACRPLTREQLHQRFDIGMGSVIATAAHCLGADLVWLEALQGNENQQLLNDDTCPDIPAIDAHHKDIAARWDAYLDAFDTNDLTRSITRVSFVTKQQYQISVADILLHLATHQAHTIAQGRNMLRQLGLTEFSRNDLVYWAIDRPFP